MRLEVFMPMKIWIVVFWVMTSCSLTNGYQHFRGMYRLHLQGRSDLWLNVVLKLWELGNCVLIPAALHSEGKGNEQLGPLDAQGF
jgi:hypothetical protein